MEKKKSNFLAKFKIFAQPQKFIFFINLFLLLMLIITLVVNQLVITQINNSLGINQNIISQLAEEISSGGILSTPASPNGVQLTGELSQDAVKLAIAAGSPNLYGNELNISFDQVQQSMNIMKQFDPTYGQNKIILNGDNLKRYTDIGLKISCEYCCSAKSIVNQSGQAACGCAHSQAMRGLAAYLIQNHGQEYSNDEILRELARWKGVYFPKQTIQKLTNQLQNGNFTPDTASLVLGLKLPNYGSGNQSAPLPSEINNLPSMVGGC